MALGHTENSKTEKLKKTVGWPDRLDWLDWMDGLAGCDPLLSLSLSLSLSLCRLATILKFRLSAAGIRHLGLGTDDGKQQSRNSCF